MPYALPSDIIEVLNPGGGTPPPGSPAAVPTSVIIDLIAEASSEVNGWLTTRYQVPFADGDVPDLVFRVTRNIAAYKTVLASNQSQPIPENHPAQLRYNSALLTCRALSVGQMTLALPNKDPGDLATAITAPTVVNQYPGQLFGLRDFFEFDRFGNL